MKEPLEEGRPATELVGKIFGSVMVVLYIVLGTTIIFKADDITVFPALYSRFFGTAMILYGIFRGYNVYRRYYSRSES